MLNRISVPKFITTHLFDYDGVDELSQKTITEIKEGLARFNCSDPEVSIVIPVWNEEFNLARTLSSFSKMKTNHKVELILVNNNSTDRTQELIDLLGVKSIFQPVQSISITRQVGLEAAKGKYHLCADGDSIYPPDWIDTMVEKLKDDNVSCVYGTHSFLPSKNNSRVTLLIHELVSGVIYFLRRQNREYLNIFGFNFGFRTQDAFEIGGFNTKRQRWSDGWMAMTLMKKGKIKRLNSLQTRVWTNTRRLDADGTILKAIIKRLKKEKQNILEYLFNTPVKSS